VIEERAQAYPKNNETRLASGSRLSRSLPNRRLQPVQIVRGALRMAGGGEDRTAVMLEDFE
jgi:hypothetical protein